MDYRKIIKFGNSSHVVSLPHEWLTKNKLNKGDVLYFEENGNNELILSPQQHEIKRENREISIDVSNKDIDDIRREIISAYIRDYNLIKIHGKDLREKTNVVRNALRELVAMEIMEQTKDFIIARDFLNIKDTSIKDIIRKIDIVVRSMLADTKLCTKEDCAEIINTRDHDVNRLAFLGLRITRKAIKEPEISKIVETGPLMFSDSWHFINCLEIFGDEIKRIARCMEKLNIRHRNNKEFIRILDDIEKSYLDIMKAYHTTDVKLAFERAGWIKTELMPRCTKLLEKFGTNNHYLIICVEKFTNMMSNLRDMARIIHTSAD